MDIKDINCNLATGFFRSANKYPDNIALEVDNACYSYNKLKIEVNKLSSFISKLKPCLSQHVGLLSYRSLTAYVSILGILAVGKAYTPLNPKFPLDRLLKIINESGTNIIVIGNECKNIFDSLLIMIEKKMIFILADTSRDDSYTNKYPQHQFYFKDDFSSIEKNDDVVPVENNDIAYLLFTSGSTGQPKGIPVSHYNVQAYIENIVNRYSINEHDRFSQMFDLNFDLSVHDMFVCWEKGACLCVPQSNDLLLPVRYIQKSMITMWFSVPSVAMFIDNYGRLDSGIFPTIRYSLFCGEALPASLVVKWKDAAFNSVIENLYGPTETTIAISGYTYNSNLCSRNAINGIVSIGKLFDGQHGRIIDESDMEVPLGEAGELCLAGTQVTSGYLNNPELTNLKYVRFPDSDKTLWYRTGDLVKKDECGCLYYLGRIDDQIKINGNRIELGEVDEVIREITGSQMVASIGWPIKDGIATGIFSFICNDSLDEKSIINYCRSKLPDYMVPKKILFIEEMPLNSNGKINRQKLRTFIQDVN